MQIILLSGGSGKRLWPLSNESRSKQFLRLLPSPDGGRESMVQRVIRQIKESGLSCPVTIATSVSQKDAITNQLGEDVTVVTEPSRRDTFPAICLASAYLEKTAKCDKNETVIVMPCDPYTEGRYFQTIAEMTEAVQNNVADLVLMGIKPTYPSAKYGYVIPQKHRKTDGIYEAERFMEKPDVATAERFIADGAFWNGGVVAIRRGYMIDIVKSYLVYDTFEEVRLRYEELPKISFDYEVAENAKSVAVVSYDGEWKDLGTWNALTDELKERCIGNVVMDEKSENTHVINELEIPVMCIGAKDMVIAASYDGILISDKGRSEHIKTYADRLQCRPMYEERRWGEYKVIDTVSFPDGYETLTRQLKIKAGKSINYQAHRYRDEVWTFIDGEGVLALDGKMTRIGRGDTVCIRKGMRHAVKGITDLLFIEVQSGAPLVKDDVEWFDWNWKS